MEHGYVTFGELTLPVDVGYIQYDISLHDILRCAVCDQVKFVEFRISVAGVGGIEPTAHIGEKSSVVNITVPGAAFVTLVPMVSHSIILSTHGKSLKYPWQDIRIARVSH